MKGSVDQLHIIAFDVPYPADYGGVIDIFHKVESLHQIGVKVHLHCYTYGRAESEELERYCESVRYYKRKVFRNPIYNKKPYIVASRNSTALIEDLLQDDYPILFEGLHSTYYLDDERLRDRLKIVRTHNVEHDYYRHLEKVENNVFKKYFFKIESERLKKYEQVLRHADVIMSISPNDTEHFKKLFADVNFLPPFHRSHEVESTIGRGEFILYHGNLSVGENNAAAIYLVSKVFSKLSMPCYIAGNGVSDELRSLVEKFEHIELKENISTGEIEKLIREAHINVLPTKQATGIKLKLINALFMGKFCVANDKMISNTGLESYCDEANSASEFISKINSLWERNFTQEDLRLRQSLKECGFCNTSGARMIRETISTAEVVPA